MRYNYRLFIMLMNDVLFFMLVGFPPDYGSRILEEFSQRLSLGVLCLGENPWAIWLSNSLKEKTKKPILATRLPPTAGATKGDPSACEDPSPSSVDSWGWILIPYINYPHSIRNRRVFDPLPDSLTIARGERS